MVQMSGFATKRMYGYVHDFARTTEEEEFITTNIDSNVANFG